VTAIAVDKLTKRYGTHLAVHDVSFTVPRGSITGFLGPNGAGKTTTLRILAGSLGKTSGTVTVAGFDVETSSLEARARIGYLPEQAPLYPEMRVVEYLTFRAELKGVARRDRRAWVDEAMEKAVVGGVRDAMIGKLSKGYRQRVGLADALVARPEIVLLDEPTAGLDPNQIHEVRALLRGLGGAHTVLLSTHVLSEVEASCDRVVVLARGELVAEGSLEVLHAAAGSFVVVLRGEPEAAKTVAAAVAEVTRVEASPGEGDTTRLVVHLAAGASIDPVVAALVSAGMGVREVSPVRTSLEEAFRALTLADVNPNVGASS
jgi:ABC-2 type transport system ATP-binding protein